MILFGIDLGGTKIECAVIDFNNNNFEIICRKRLFTEARLGYKHILQQIKRLLNDVVSEIGITPESIGIATPGILDNRTHKIKNCNILCVNGQSFKEDLEELLKLDVSIANDANCFTLAESVFGSVPIKAPGAKVVFGAILGTGIGGGVVIDKKIHAGRHGIAGEWGHNSIDSSGISCYCGKRGCLEKYLSGPSLEEYYYTLTKRRLPLKKIAELYNEGSDPNAKEVIIHLLSLFGKAIAEVINTFDPDAIVLGGGVSNIDLLYTESAKFVTPFLFNDYFETPILKNTLSDSAGVFGAALLKTCW